MTAVCKRTVSLPVEQASYIDAQVTAGIYASASEVVRAGLRALQERDTLRGMPDDRMTVAECGRQARVIRDAETASMRAEAEAWFELSDRTGWTV